MIASQTEFPKKAKCMCNECIELSGEILTEEYEKDDLSLPSKVIARLCRTIEFPPEYRQAGLSILNYFSEFLKQKSPTIEARIRIEQLGNNVRLIVDSNSGEMEIVEKTLQSYGSIIKGESLPEDHLEDPLHVMALRNKLEVTAMELRHTRDLLKLTSEEKEARISSLESQVKSLQFIVGSGLQSVSELSQVFCNLILANSSNESLAKSLEIISRIMERGIRVEDKIAVEKEFQNIARSNPKILKEMSEFFRGSLAGVGGNILYSWLVPIINSLPK